MRLVFNYIFLLLTSIGTTVYLLQFTDYKLPTLLQNHLNDLLIIPIVLWIALTVLRTLLLSQNIRIPLSYIVIIVIGYSFYFEYYLPIVNARYTADPWDVICYILGGVFFYFWQKHAALE